MAEDPITPITTHTVSLLRVAAGLRQQALARLEDLSGEITQQIEKSPDLSPNRLAKLEALLDQTNRSVSQAYRDIQQTQTSGLKKIAKLEGQVAVQNVNHQIGIPLVSTIIPEKLLEAVVDGNLIEGNSSKAWWEGQADDLRNKFRAQMQQGVLLGESIDDLTKRVRGTRAANYEDGLMAAKKREAAALVRSSVISIANEARLRQYQEMSDVVKGIQWVSTLDLRTTAQCRGLDGKVWRLPDYKPVGHDKAFPGPTAHWGCRSTQVAVLRSWEELSGKELPSLDEKTIEQRMKELAKQAGKSDDWIDGIRANTRASLDGQVHESVDFEKWLRLQSPGRVEAILGPGRKALWDAGQLTVTQMTDQQNRPLTIEQLEALIQNGTPLPETQGRDFLPAVVQTPDLSAKLQDELNAKAQLEIDQILAAPDGQKMKAKWLQKLKQQQPDLEPAALLANATQQAIEEQNAKTKALVLAAAKKNMVAGKALTPAQKAAIDALGAEEAEAFSQAVADAQLVQQQALELELQKQQALEAKKQLVKQKIIDAEAGENTWADLDAIPDEELALLTKEEKDAAAQEGMKLKKKEEVKQKIIAATQVEDYVGALSQIPNSELSLLTVQEKSEAIQVGLKAAKKTQLLALWKKAGETGSSAEIDALPQADKDLLTTDEKIQAYAAGQKVMAKNEKLQEITKLWSTGANVPSKMAAEAQALGATLQEIDQAVKLGQKALEITGAKLAIWNTVATGGTLTLQHEQQFKSVLGEDAFLKEKLKALAQATQLVPKPQKPASQASKLQAVKLGQFGKDEWQVKLNDQNPGAVSDAFDQLEAVAAWPEVAISLETPDGKIVAGIAIAEPGSPMSSSGVLIGHVGSLQPGGGTAAVVQAAKVAADQGVGIQVIGVSGQSEGFWQKLGFEKKGAQWQMSPEGAVKLAAWQDQSGQWLEDLFRPDPPAGKPVQDPVAAPTFTHLYASEKPKPAIMKQITGTPATVKALKAKANSQWLVDQNGIPVAAAEMQIQLGGGYDVKLKGENAQAVYQLAMNMAANLQQDGKDAIFQVPNGVPNPTGVAGGLFKVSTTPSTLKTVKTHAEMMQLLQQKIDELAPAPTTGSFGDGPIPTGLTIAPGLYDHLLVASIHGKTTHHLVDPTGKVSVGAQMMNDPIDKLTYGVIAAEDPQQLAAFTAKLIETQVQKGDKSFSFSSYGAKFPNGSDMLYIGGKGDPTIQEALAQLKGALPTSAPAPMKIQNGGIPIPVPQPPPSGATLSGNPSVKAELANFVKYGKPIFHTLDATGTVNGMAQATDMHGKLVGQVAGENEMVAHALGLEVLKKAKLEGYGLVSLEMVGTTHNWKNGSLTIDADPGNIMGPDLDTLIGEFEAFLGKTVVPAPKPTPQPPPKPAPVVTPTQAPNPGAQVPSFQDLTFEKTLPGSTAPGLYRDTNGKKWVVKEAKNVSAAHLANEMLADDLYRAAGVQVPMGRLVDGRKITEFIEGASTLASKSGAARQALNEKLKENFVLDALLGNWDVVGLSADNVLVAGDVPIRVDNGGALLFRAMGTKKTDEWLGGEIRELKTLVNKRTNAQTAEVFGGITKAEIETQMIRLLDQRDDLLRVAARDPEALKYLTARFDWMEQQVGAKRGTRAAKKTARKAAAAIPADIDRILQRPTTEGWSYMGDERLVEDNRVLFWREKDQAGQLGTMAQLRLTHEGSSLLRKKLEAAGYVKKAGKTAGQAPQPAQIVYPDYDAIVQAAKTINHHTAAGTPEKANPTKIQAAQNAKASLKAWAQKHKDNPAEVAKVEQLTEMLDNVLDAHAKKQKAPTVSEPMPVTKTIKAWSKWLGPNAQKVGVTLPDPNSLVTYTQMKLIETDIERKLQAAPKGGQAPAPAQELAGWSVDQLDAWAPPKKAVQNGILTVQGGTVTNKTGTEYFKMQKDGVQVEFHPRNPDPPVGSYGGSRPGRANEGTVVVRIPGDAGPDTVQRALEVMSELGIDSSPASDTWKEQLYIHRNVFLRNHYDEPGYRAIWDDQTLDPEQKLEKMKAWAEARYNVKLPRGGRSSWTKAYNPEGRLLAGETGHRVFDRWDVTEAEMEKALKGMIFTHKTDDVVAAVEGFLKNGGVFSTTHERVRLGVSLSAGASASADLDTGGAIYSYFNLTKLTPAVRKRTGFLLKPRAAMRQDLYSLQMDAFGAREYLKNRATTPAELATRHGTGMIDSGLFKNGVSILDDDVEAIVAGNAATRTKVLKVLRDAGVNEIGGRPIEQVVIE